MKKPKLRELREAITSVISKPFTTRFPYEPAPAPDGYRGKGQFNEDECIGCGACAEVCPADAIDKIDDTTASPPVRRLVRHDDICIFCNHCGISCTTKEGIECTPEYELSTLDRSTCERVIEKELLLCDMCGEVISTKEHLQWLARKLGAQRYTNPTLIMVGEERLDLASAEAERGDVEGSRGDIMRVLCPHCRRQVVLREVWG